MDRLKQPVIVSLRLRKDNPPRKDNEEQFLLLRSGRFCADVGGDDATASEGAAAPQSVGDSDKKRRKGNMFDDMCSRLVVLPNDFWKIANRLLVCFFLVSSRVISKILEIGQGPKMFTRNFALVSGEHN